MGHRDGAFVLMIVVSDHWHRREQAGGAVMLRTGSQPLGWISVATFHHNSKKLD